MWPSPAAACEWSVSDRGGDRVFWNTEQLQWALLSHILLGGGIKFAKVHA